MANIRPLKELEQNACVQVFHSTIDYSNVRVADDLGLGGRPWCSPPGWGFLGYFCLHVGPAHFEGDMSQQSPGLLIHEMVHVWQGQHNVPFWYVINSGCNQVISMTGNGSPNGAYDVDSESQQQWKDYGAEQQAMIVEGWRLNGMSSFDWRFRYIRDNIRAENPWASSQPIAPLTPFVPMQQRGHLVSRLHINWQR